MPGGDPHADSDVDLLVIVKTSAEPAYRRARAVYRSLRDVYVPVDVLVKTRDEVEKKLAVVASLEYQVMLKGKVLYG